MIVLAGLAQPHPFEQDEGHRVVLTLKEWDALVREAEGRDDDEA